MIKVAFGSVPKESGTFTFYRNQRKALAKHGVEMYCVALGAQQAAMWDKRYEDENCVLLAPKNYSYKKQSQAFVNWCTDNKINIVIGVNSIAILSSYPHLPVSIRILARCANAFDHGYRITMSCAERLMKIIALTPRLERDLIEHYNADKDKIALIPNGIEASKFTDAREQVRGQEDYLRISFVGRLEHQQKGVLHIPLILKELEALNVPYKVNIAGQGKHEQQLRFQLKEAQLESKVTFHGALAEDDVIKLLGKSDIYLFTSHFEGCPNSLLEAMMAACVPVCWLIEGITDFIVKSGSDGLVYPLSSYKAMAKGILKLHEDRDYLKQMSVASGQTAINRFDNTITASAYADVFKEVMKTEPPAFEVKSFKSFRLEENFKPTNLKYIPLGLREKFKSQLKRFGSSNIK